MNSKVSDEPGADKQTIPPRGFALFSHLPTELRIQIWQASLDLKPRVLEVHHAKLSTFQWQSGCLNLAALSACYESRALALAAYPVAFPLHGGRSLYLNPAVDTLLITSYINTYFLDLILAEIRRQDPTNRGLRRLGIPLESWSREFSDGKHNRTARALLRGLEEFIMHLYKSPASSTEPRAVEWMLRDCLEMEGFRKYDLRARWGPNFWGVEEPKIRIVFLDFIVIRNGMNE